MPTTRSCLAFAPILLALLGAGCDNVGRAFDPDVNPPPDPEPTASAVQVVPVGGNVIDARPKVRATYPKDVVLACNWIQVRHFRLQSLGLCGQCP